MENVINEDVHETSEFFDNLKWMTVKETAVYLRRSYGAIKNLIYRDKIRARKYCGRVYIKKCELDGAIEAGLL